jgi:hypothetical protein
MNTRYCIITPVRDEETYIAKTVESVLAQTIRPQEWIMGGHDVRNCLPIGTPQFGSSNRHAFSEQRDGGSVDVVVYGDWPLKKKFGNSE